MKQYGIFKAVNSALKLPYFPGIRYPTSRRFLMSINSLTRRWQREFYNRWIQHPSKDFLLAAIPAAGKTRAAFAVACTFLENNIRRRIIVVSPTRNICSGWKKEARETFKRQLLTEEFRLRKHLNDPEFHGTSVTYQTIASDPLKFRKICDRYQIIVIFDEIHHLRENAPWGEAIAIAFESAIKRLALSGTPFRTDGAIIPFLTIENNEYRIDYRYDYPDALEDGVIRELSFHRYSGSVTYKVNGELVTYNTDDGLTKVLKYDRIYLKGLLSAAHEKLLEVRKSKPDAGGLILCVDTDHAVLIGDLLYEITKTKADLIFSDTERATSTVDEFRNDQQRLWAVAVRQISEGVDIKRLMVLAYATNYITLLSFRQAIGRVMRHEQTEVDTEAYVFIPQHPDLLKYAEEVEKFQTEVLRKREEKERTIGGEKEEGPFIKPKIEYIGSTGAEFEGLTTRSLHYDCPTSEEILEFAKKYGITEAKAAAILQDLRQKIIDNSIVDVPDNEKELATIRVKCSKLANQLAFARNCEPKDIHTEWIKRSNVATAKMTLSQFRLKLAWLNQELGYEPKSSG